MTSFEVVPFSRWVILRADRDLDDKFELYRTRVGDHSTQQSPVQLHDEMFVSSVADVYGPSVPLMLGLSGSPMVSAQQKLVPLEKHGIKVMSMGLLLRPDQAVVWGTALGLQSDIEQVLQRSAEDVQSGMTSNAWFPAWYGSGLSSGGGTPGQAGIAPGLFSSSGIPDFGGMMSALGTIGNSPSSSGSGGSSGGFSGGGGGGGGGGAGGGY